MLKDLEPLPDALYRGGRRARFNKGDRYIPMGLKGAQLHQPILRPTRYIGDNRPRVLLLQLLALPPFIRYDNHL